MKVVLIGFSGTGKSSVGKSLADRLGWEFVDTDVDVERVAGKRIHQIFAEEGEPVFRRLESEAVRRALDGRPQVVAVGGGAVVDPHTRAAVRDGNLVVLLDAEVDTIHRRLAVDVSEEPRPMLGMGGRGDTGTRGHGDEESPLPHPDPLPGGEGTPPLPLGEGRGEGPAPSTQHSARETDALHRIRTLKAVRDPIYRETAHVVVSTDGIDVEEVVGRVAVAVKTRFEDRGEGEREQ